MTVLSQNLTQDNQAHSVNLLPKRKNRLDGPRVWPHGRRHFAAAAVGTAFIGLYDSITQSHVILRVFRCPKLSY